MERRVHAKAAESNAIALHLCACLSRSWETYVAAWFMPLNEEHQSASSLNRAYELITKAVECDEGAAPSACFPCQRPAISSGVGCVLERVEPNLCSEPELHRLAVCPSSGVRRTPGTMCLSCSASHAHGCTLFPNGGVCVGCWIFTSGTFLRSHRAAARLCGSCAPLFTWEIFTRRGLCAAGSDR